MEGVVVFDSKTFQVKQKRPQMSQQGLVLDYAEDLIDGGPEWSEAGVDSVDLNGVPGGIQLRSLLEVVLSLVLSLL